MKRLLAGLFALFFSTLASAQGTLPIALTQQFSFTNCATFTNACGTPLSGGLLYFYQVGTVATPQQSFQDTGLTILNPWPLVLDANGRIPSFYLANGSIHVRLTDSSGNVQFDVINQLVIGPSSGGGGGGGGSIDPTTIASTGDIKFRPTTEVLTGWVRLNGLTIGSAVSGATGRANADTQSLFIYLWTNCPDAHCPVVGGRGGTGLADFNANKQLTLLDMRGRNFAGLDDMGATAAGRILSSNVTSGGSDTTTTPQATGGEANHALSVAELAAHNHTASSVVTDPGHSHLLVNTDTNGPDVTSTTFINKIKNGTNDYELLGTSTQPTLAPSQTITTGVTVATTTSNNGSGTAHNNMAPFMLGTWHQKL
jgi:hypothetical protein